MENISLDNLSEIPVTNCESDNNQDFYLLSRNRIILQI